LPAGPTGLALKRPQLMAQGQHVGAKPGLGPAPDNQDLEQQANHDAEKGVEHQRGVSQGARRPGSGPAKKLLTL